MSKARSLLYKLARLMGDIEAAHKAVKRRSAKPLAKRLYNKVVGRKVVSKLWWR